MENLLVRILLIEAVLQLGIQLSELPKAISHPAKLKSLTRAVVEVDWKPISIFPEERKRFSVSQGKRAGRGRK